MQTGDESTSFSASRPRTAKCSISPPTRTPNVKAVVKEYLRMAREERTSGRPAHPAKESVMDCLQHLGADALGLTWDRQHRDARSRSATTIGLQASPEGSNR